ncbi:MAG: BGTF surface domain-containing protein [Halobacteriota archaeon]
MTDSPLRTLAMALLLLIAAVGSVATAIPVAAADDDLTIDHKGDAVTVANDSSQVVSGTADLRVGTELVVRLQSSGDTEPRFIQVDNAVVTEDGTWAVAFNFSRQQAGDTFDLRVATENGSLVSELPGEIVECEGDCTEPTPAQTPTPRPEQTQTTAPPSEQQSDVEVKKQVMVVDRGDVVAVELEVDSDETVSVSLGSERDAGYELHTVVSDDDGDGSVVLYVDTSLAGREGRTVSASGGDSVSVSNETSLDSMLDAGEYGISVYAGDEASGEPVEVGTLVVQSDEDRATGGSSGEPTEATAGANATPTERPATDDGLGQGTRNILFGGAFLLGGAVLAVILLRD